MSKRTCLFCGARANSVEHIFMQSFRDKLGVSELNRAFSQVDGFGARTVRPERLFDAKVKRVCRECNHGWMNRLDLDVEAWIVDPDSLDAWQAIDATTFRRWAIKLALMRSMLDTPGAVPREHFDRLYCGDDVEEWQVFVGRAHFKELRHAFSVWGCKSAPNGSMKEGILHASWAVGTAVTSTIYIPAGRTPPFFPAFARHNRSLGKPLVNVPHGAAELPDIFSSPKLAPFQTEPFFMFFTPERVSPIAQQMRKYYESVRPLSGAHLLGDAS
jgi:hypothetical protein